MHRRLPEAFGAARPGDTAELNRLEVFFWARRLINAEDKRREAEREYQRVLMELRGALGSAQ
jgi:hypothetical protein